MTIRAYKSDDQDAVIALWEACGLTRPWNNPRLDIERKVSRQDNGFIVLEENNAIIASAMFAYDGHRGSVNYLAVSPEHQGRAIGSQLMTYIETQLIALGCPKINLLVRSDNEKVITFYQSLGYGVDDALALGKRLIED